MYMYNVHIHVHYMSMQMYAHVHVHVFNNNILYYVTYSTMYMYYEKGTILRIFDFSVQSVT